MKKILTILKEHKVIEIQENFTGKIVLILHCNCGGITKIDREVKDTVHI
jgi:hypothetical protein